MIVAAALSFAAACCAVAIVAWLRGRSDRQDRLVALDALARAEAVNASLYARLTRKPAAKAQAETRRACATEALVSGRTVDDVVRERVA